MLRDTRPSSTCSYLTRAQLQLAALLLTVSVCAPANAADIYKWTDKEGGQHYSEQPPAGVKYEIVSPRYAAPISSPSAQPKSEPQSEQTRVDQGKQEQQKAEAVKVRMQNCITVQKRLEDLQSASRITLKNPDGTVQRLTEEERQAKITEAQEMIKQYCD